MLLSHQVSFSWNPSINQFHLSFSPILEYFHRLFFNHPAASSPSPVRPAACIFITFYRFYQFIIVPPIDFHLPSFLPPRAFPCPTGSGHLAFSSGRASFFQDIFPAPSRQQGQAGKKIGNYRQAGIQERGIGMASIPATCPPSPVCLLCACLEGIVCLSASWCMFKLSSNLMSFSPCPVSPRGGGEGGEGRVCFVFDDSFSFSSPPVPCQFSEAGLSPCFHCLMHSCHRLPSFPFFFFFPAVCFLPALILSTKPSSNS